jgi:putative DNA primase/helicase
MSDIHVNTPNGSNSDDEAIASLAALPRPEYERQRKEQAKRLGYRTAVLDKVVEERRTKGNGALQGSAVMLPDIELWPQRVNGAEVLRKVAECFTCYVALPDGGADLLALWCAHTHIFQAFLCSPRLNITSPERGCGKSTLRDVVALFVPRPVLTENLSVAVLFRLVDAHAPVILADEYDAWLKDNEELRGLLNAGHRRGAAVYRCEGDGHEVRAFKAYTPAVLCGIGALPGTLHDRSIVVRLERAKPGELRTRFDPRHTEKESELCRKLARWCADNRQRIQKVDPRLPNGVFNRLADNWRPLFAIAEVLAEDWPKRCGEALVKLTRGNDVNTESLLVSLLADIREVFDCEWGTVRMFSKYLINALQEMSERPWQEANRGKPITERWLASKLAAFGIHSKTLRIGEQRGKRLRAGRFHRGLRTLLARGGGFYP